MRRIAIGSLFVVALVALILLGFNQRSQDASASHVIDTVDLVAIDAVIDDDGDTIPDNDDNLIGPIQTCVSIPLVGGYRRRRRRGR